MALTEKALSKFREKRLKISVNGINGESVKQIPREAFKNLGV